MSLDARPQTRDARPADFDGSHRDCGASRPLPADDEITVLRLAVDRDTRTPQAYDDDATVLRAAGRARKTS